MKTVTTDIRFAEEGDCDALARVHSEAWREAYSGIVPFKNLNAMIARRHSGWWHRTVRSGAGVLVCEFDSRVIGYATLGRNRTRSLAADGEIYELYLEPVCQGIGFGRRLFETARHLLSRDDAQGLVVWALSDNGRAIDFYKHLGGADLAEGRERFGDRELRKIAFLWK